MLEEQWRGCPPLDSSSNTGKCHAPERRCGNARRRRKCDEAKAAGELSLLLQPAGLLVPLPSPAPPLLVPLLLLLLKLPPALLPLPLLLLMWMVWGSAAPQFTVASSRLQTKAVTCCARASNTAFSWVMRARSFWTVSWCRHSASSACRLPNDGWLSSVARPKAKHAMLGWLLRCCACREGKVAAALGGGQREGPRRAWHPCLMALAWALRHQPWLGMHSKLAATPAEEAHKRAHGPRPSQRPTPSQPCTIDALSAAGSAAPREQAGDTNGHGTEGRNCAPCRSHYNWLEVNTIVEQFANGA